MMGGVGWAVIACAVAAQRVEVPLDRPDWRQLVSSHFVLWTDDPPEVARDLMAQLERNYAALDAIKEFTFGSRPDPPDRVNVVVFRRRQDFQSIVPDALRNHRGFYIEPDGVPFVVTREPVHSSTFSHELMHRFVHHYLWRAPVWLNEGLAVFYENFHIEDDRVTFGFFPQLPTRDELQPLDRTLHAAAQEFYDPKQARGFYASASMLVYLLNSYAPDAHQRFAVYVAALGRGTPGAEAWQQAYGTLSAERLEQLLDQSLKQWKFAAWRTPYTAPAPLVASDRKLSDFDVHLLWLQVMDWTTVTGKAAVPQRLAEMRAAKKDDPDVLYWSGRYELMFGERDEAKRLLESAAQARPGDPRIWIVLARLELADQKKRPKRERTSGPALEQLKKCARTADELNFVAWYLSEIGNPTAGIPYAVHALEKAPGCYYCRDTMAQIFFQRGAFARAVDEQRLAVNLMPEYAAVKARLEYGQRLLEYERAAAGAPH